MQMWHLPLAEGEEGWIRLILFFVIIVGSLVVQIVKKIRGEADESDQPTLPRRTTTPSHPAAPPPKRAARPYTAESDEVRKFLEALGRPRTAAPPPPVLRPVPAPAQRPPI